jgi:hypothetical protein
VRACAKRAADDHASTSCAGIESLNAGTPQGPL